MKEKLGLCISSEPPKDNIAHFKKVSPRKRIKDLFTNGEKVAVILRSDAIRCIEVKVVHGGKEE